MRYIFFITLFMISFSVAADERAALYGTWGTEKQCARAPVVPGSLVESEPFTINSQWLKRGVIWCKLAWFSIEKREDGFFTGANALCGEDIPRRYLLSMTLSNEELTILWDFPNKHGPLKMCKGS